VVRAATDQGAYVVSIKSVLKAAAAAVILGLSAAPAHAALIMGSRVDESVFLNAVGSQTGWAYVGRDTQAFTTGGYARLVGRASPYHNSFGYMSVDHSGKTEVFDATAGLGTPSAGNYSVFIPFSPLAEFIFYFQADAMALADVGTNLDFSDGGGSGDLEIFRNVANGTWAFFFDDGGGLSDTDFDDLVVTFDQGVNVPVTGALPLFGLAALGVFYMRRRKKLTATA